MYYDLIDYFDVWGNEIDGYEVNNLCTIKSKIYIDNTANDNEIIDFLINIGYLNSEAKNRVELIWYDDSFCEIEDKFTSYPLGRLIKSICI